MLIKLPQKELNFSLNCKCLIIFLVLCSSTIEAKTILIIGSDTLSLNKVIEQTNNTPGELIGIVPNYSFENPNNAIEKLPFSFRNEMKSKNVYIDKTIDSLLTQVEDVVLLSHNGNLDFNSAVKVLIEKKNLILEQPQKFKLADAIVLFALSQKYRVKLEIFANNNLEYLNDFFDAEIKEVKKKNEEITLISKNRIDTLQCNNQDTNNSKRVNARLKNISQLWDDQSEIHESDYLHFFTLINVIAKCKSMDEQHINLTDEYIFAFDVAYSEMTKFN